MAFILAEQLYDDDRGDGALARYQEYLTSVRGQFPARAYALATSDGTSTSTITGPRTTRGSSRYRSTRPKIRRARAHA
jgi:hypothetical protein